MPLDTPPALAPRKSPQQQRSKVTVDAIFEATIQVLLRDGMSRLTTTSVAERAGVSVGTMYQYFPNKQALIYALNARYLDQLASRIEAVCLENHGACVEKMVKALVITYWTAKTERVDVTRALYRSVAELDNEAMIRDFAQRTNLATETMLRTACDRDFPDPAAVNLTLVTVIFGTVRNAFERGLDQATGAAMRNELIEMCLAYVAKKTT